MFYMLEYFIVILVYARKLRHLSIIKLVSDQLCEHFSPGGSEAQSTEIFLRYIKKRFYCFSFIPGYFIHFCSQTNCDSHKLT